MDSTEENFAAAPEVYEGNKTRFVEEKLLRFSKFQILISLIVTFMLAVLTSSVSRVTSEQSTENR